MTTFEDLVERSTRVGAVLAARGETVSVAEGAAGGLMSAALLAVPGASRYYVGGMVVYTLVSRTALIGDIIPSPAKLRGASEPWATFAADGARAVLGTTWALGEGGAAGPDGNRYGDPSGHAWVAVSGPVAKAHNVLTGLDDRVANMFEFAAAGLDLLAAALDEAPPATAG
jgi:nicotinamide-nucleotide amidase